MVRPRQDPHQPTERLEIRCAGRAFNHSNNKPVGRVCARLFTSTVTYTTRTTWIDLARVAGWKVSLLQPDRTVTAMCPRCATGKKP